MSNSDSTTDHARPLHIDDEESLDAFIEDHSVALVEFYTDGCSMCQAMEPVLGNVARATDVAVGLANPRDDPPLVERFQVQSVPLLVLFVDGEPVDRKAEGFVGADELVSWLGEQVSID